MNTNEVRDLFTRHRTIRKYKKFEMPQEHLELIQFAGQRAPTDATAQMATVIRLSDLSLKREMASLTKNAHIETASEAFVICADVHRLDVILKQSDFEMAEWQEIARHFAIGDAVLVGQNMLLCAELLGYQGCWIGGVVSALEPIATALKLPQNVIPFAALTLGVPDEEPAQRPRLSIENVFFENHYPETFANLSGDIDRMGAITARGDWADTLSRYFADGGAMESREKSYIDFLAKRWFAKD